MTQSSDDDETLVIPRETPEKLLARHAEECVDLSKRHDRIRSSIPRKHRAERARFAEQVDADKKQLEAVQKQEREEAGLTDAVLAAEFAHLSIEHLTSSPASGNAKTTDKQQKNIQGAEGNSSNPNSEAMAEQHTQQQQPRESKAARRRRKKAEEEAASAARVEAARAAMGQSAKAVELSEIDSQLRPAGLRIHTIKADGHCLYGAIAHQLHTLSGEDFHSDDDPSGSDKHENERSPKPAHENLKALASVEALRAATADHLWHCRDSFIPFVESVDGDETRFRSYCNTVRDTAEWGGQVELRALAERLQVAIEVYAAGMPVVKMGVDSAEPETSSETKPILRVSFHRKYLGLGEHYNSVMRA